MIAASIGSSTLTTTVARGPEMKSKSHVRHCEAIVSNSPHAVELVAKEII